MSQIEIRHVIGKNGSFVLRSVSGDVTLSGTDGDEAIVVARGSQHSLNDLVVERSPGGLLIEPPRTGLPLLRNRDGGHVEFHVTLPRGARLDVKAVSADITGSSLYGEQEYKNVSGDIRITGVGGRLNVQSVSGDIRLSGGARLELTATSTSGDVTLEAQLIDLLRVRTVSGDVRMTGRLADGPRHSVETVSGDLGLRSFGGVTVEPSRALDIGRNSRRPVVIGDGRAQLSFRSMSGEDHVTAEIRPERERQPAGRPIDADPATSTYQTVAHEPAPPTTRMHILRALERGEIDVEEAARRLEEVGVDA